MNIKEAVDIIEANWPDERYTMLREALVVVLGQLPTTDNSDYAKCSHELLDNLLGNYSSEQHMKAMLILKSHFA